MPSGTFLWGTWIPAMIGCIRDLPPSASQAGRAADEGEAQEKEAEAEARGHMDEEVTEDEARDADAKYRN